MLVAALAYGTAGCSDALDEASLVTSAQSRLERDDYAGAEIDVRNLLGLNETSPAGRYLLAQILLERNDFANAENQLRRAAEFGHPEEQVAPLMARIMNEQNRAAEVIERYRGRQPEDAQSAAQLYTELARAYWSTGEEARAETLLDQALARVPDYAPALVVRARVAGSRGKVDLAHDIAHDLTAKQSQYAEGWVLLGDLLARTQKGAQDAVRAYRKAVELKPKLVAAHSGLITLYQRLGDKQGVDAQVAAMSKALPGNPTTLFYEAVAAYGRGDFAKARERLQFLLRRAGDQVELLYLAGLTEARLNALAFAETLLNRAVALAPAAAEPRRALAGLYVRMGEVDRALSHIQVLQSANADDPVALSLLGTLHARNGDFRAADEAFGRAAKLQPEDPRIRAAMGRSLLARGMVEPGLRELQAAAQLDSANVDHDIELVIFHMRRNEPNAALRAVDDMAREQPKSPVPDHVRGRILQVMGENAAAIKAYESAVAKDRRHLGAISSLAEIDIAAGRLDAARKRYQAYLELEPNSSKAMMALAVLARRSGASRAEAAEWVDRAVAANPGDVSTWREAIEFHQRDGDTLAALYRAQRAIAAIPDNADLLRLLASAQLASGDKQRAIDSLNRSVRLQPKWPNTHILLGLTQLSVGNLAAAKEAIDAAAKLAPAWPPVLRARITLALAGHKDLAAARAIALEQQRTHPKQALGWQLEGEIEGGRGNWPESVAAFQQALARDGSNTHIARQLHDAMVNAGQVAEAAALGQRWTTSHPADAEFRTHLAQSAVKQQNFEQAAEHLRVALKLRPDDPLLLNNLAMTLLALGQPDALETAQRAVKLAPHHPGLLDTLAQALASRSKLDKAIETQALAVKLAPQSSAMRLRLARYYLSANRKEEAKAELRLLTRAGTPEAERDLAEKLLGQLAG